MTRFENAGVFKREKVWLKNSLSQNRKVGDRVVEGSSTETGCGG